MKKLTFFYTLATLSACFLVFSCEKDEEELMEICDPYYSDRTSSRSIGNAVGFVVQKGGEYLIKYGQTHYYACNLPNKYKNAGEEVLFGGKVLSNISHFIDDGQEGNEAVVDKGPCTNVEAAAPCDCQLMELTEIKPEYMSSPIW